jgi:hypothetical protein
MISLPAWNLLFDHSSVSPSMDCLQHRVHDQNTVDDIAPDLIHGFCFQEILFGCLNILLDNNLRGFYLSSGHVI